MDSLDELAQVLCLVRHGEAVGEAENPARPLTGAGRVHAERSGSWLAAMGLSADEIRHSGKLRARETAEIMARNLGVPPDRVREHKGLGPNDRVEDAAAEMVADHRTLVVVGHLPFLGRLASYMLVGDPDRVPLRISESGIVLLGRTGGTWKLVGLVAPDLMPV